MRSRKAVVFALLLLAVMLSLGGVYELTRPDERTEVQAEISVFDVLSSEDSGFARALNPREFSFPADHGPHPEYGIEWWYYTGNLDTAQGRHFGFELTFFRIGLTSEEQDRDSDWAASQLYMAHLGFTDVEGGRFYSFERFIREALGLSGAQASPFRVWLEDWSAASVSSETLPMRLQASEGDIAIDLTLDSVKPVVLHGKDGLSQKSAGPGNASYYYSFTRMPASGTVRVGSQSFQVSGMGWMDREWSTTALAENQAGWDWFALQLSDGREVMYYQLRLRDGAVGSFSSGTIVMEDGSTRTLKPEDVHIEVLDRWGSPRGGTYPSRWRIYIPSESLEVEVIPYIQAQEMDVSVRYWEGAVRISGTAAGQPVSGSGYVEMTGYATESGGRS
jgi:predicted secreted hydrolase